MTQASHSLCVPARFAALPELLDAINAIAEQAGNQLERTTLLRAQTAVEELFANSIHHGYGGESEQPVWLEVICSAQQLIVIYADAAAAFDPFAAMGQTRLALANDGKAERLDKLGGVGRQLIHGLADHASYRRMLQGDGGRNEIRLEFSSRPTTVGSSGSSADAE